MADKEAVWDWDVHLSRQLQVLAASFPEHFPPDHVAELKCDNIYDGLPKCLKAMVAYLKADPQEKSYSDYLWAAREAEKGDSMELSQSQQSQVAENTAKPRATSFFPLLCAWHTWKRRVLRKMKRWRVKTPVILMGSWRSLWCALQGLLKMPKWKRSTVTIVVVWNTSSMTAHH